LSRTLVWNPNPTIDVVSELASLQVGRVQSALKQTFSAGGKGTLVMRGLSALGVAYDGITPIGGPSGEFAAELMRSEGLNCEFTRVNGLTRAAVTLAEANGVDTNVNGPGPVVDDSLWKGHVDLVETLVQSQAYDTFVVAGRPPLGADATDLARVCQSAAKAGLRAVLDLAQPFLEVGLEAAPWLVKINQLEAAACCAGESRSEIDALTDYELVDELKQMGAQNVVLTSGPRRIFGDLLGVRVAADPPAIELRSAVGCGDSFLAGLLYALRVDSNDVANAVKWAAAVASASAEDLRPGYFSVDRATVLLSFVRVSATS
jgi:1-phosphofructokinase